MTLTQLAYVVKIADTKSMNKAAELNKLISEKYVEQKRAKKKFSVSMQHYSFAVEAFIELGNQLSVGEFELAVHETKTHEVIDNVRNYRSEIGVLYLNDFNEKMLKKIFAENDLEFFPLFVCGVSVYLSKNHPLAGQNRIRFDELKDYPCLSFEQGEKNSFYFAEEVLNGGNFVSVPLDTEDTMTIGYVKRKNMPLSLLGQKYIEILKKIWHQIVPIYSIHRSPTVHL